VTDPCDLDRFVSAQEPVFDTVLRELRSHRKRSHWMWFVFPQLRALGRSSMTDYYGISSLAEARAYLANRCWPRLDFCTRTVLEIEAASLHGRATTCFSGRSIAGVTIGRTSEHSIWSDGTSGHRAAILRSETRP